MQKKQLVLSTTWCVCVFLCIWFVFVFNVSLTNGEFFTAVVVFDVANVSVVSWGLSCYGSSTDNDVRIKLLLMMILILLLQNRRFGFVWAFEMWSSHQPSHPPDTVREGGILSAIQAGQTRRWSGAFVWHSLRHPIYFTLLPSPVHLLAYLFNSKFKCYCCCCRWFFWQRTVTGNGPLTCTDETAHLLWILLWLLFFQPVEFPVRVGSLCSLLTFLPCVVDLHTNKREHTDASLYTHLVLSVVLLQKEHLQSVQLLSEFFIEYSMWEANEKEATDKSRSRIAIPFIPFVRDYGPPSPWNFLCVAPNVNAMPPFGWR